MLAGEPPFTGPTAQAIVAQGDDRDAAAARVPRRTRPAARRGGGAAGAGEAAGGPVRDARPSSRGAGGGAGAGDPGVGEACPAAATRNNPLDRGARPSAPGGRWVGMVSRPAARRAGNAGCEPAAAGRLRFRRGRHQQRGPTSRPTAGGSPSSAPATRTTPSGFGRWTPAEPPARRHRRRDLSLLVGGRAQPGILRGRAAQADRGGRRRDTRPRARPRRPGRELELRGCHPLCP